MVSYLHTSNSMNNSLEKPCILLIDDTVEEQRKLLELLRQHYRISVAFDGQSGYQRALALRPSLILLDVRMPRSDGFSTCRLLKADPATRDIPVIFVTSAYSVDERIEGLTIGGVDYVAKPFVPEEVLARVRIHLELSSRSPLIKEPTSTSMAARNPDEVMVEAAKKLISQYLHAPLQLPEIAKRIGTYEKKLTQTFREITGLTVFAFIREERISRARQLLADTDLSMQDIADQVGFQSAANFATAFRERMNITPSAYRQAQQNAHDA